MNHAPFEQRALVVDYDASRRKLTSAALEQAGFSVTEPYVPMFHPFVETLIGGVRREDVDHVLFWTTHDLEKKLTEFDKFYNHHRTHSRHALQALSFPNSHVEIRKRRLSEIQRAVVIRQAQTLPEKT